MAAQGGAGLCTRLLGWRAIGLHLHTAVSLGNTFPQVPFSEKIPTLD